MKETDGFLTLSVYSAPENHQIRKELSLFLIQTIEETNFENLILVNTPVFTKSFSSFRISSLYANGIGLARA